MVATSVLKAFAKIPLSTPVVNRVLGIDTVPALALPKEDTATARFLGSLLYW
jgi:hypothetical protein